MNSAARKALLKPYEPPKWASSLKGVPTSKISMAKLPTPIELWEMPGKPDDFEIYLKRDDLTGCSTSGNKIRKMEFSMAAAIEQGCTHVMTCGSMQSNHCRTVAIACASLGLKAHLFHSSDIQDVNAISYDGNMVLTKLSGANLYLANDSVHNMDSRMNQLAREIKEATGEKSYVIPFGGSDSVAFWSFMDCFEEIRNQVKASGTLITDVVCVALGGMCAAMAIANYLCGSPYRMHGVEITPDPVFEAHLIHMLDELGIKDVKYEDLLYVHKDYIGPGYGLNGPNELKFVCEVARKTGQFFDSTYVGKAGYATSDMAQHKPEVFKGKKVLFLHSGGIYSLLSHEMSKNLIPLVKESVTTICPPAGENTKILPS